MSNTVIVQIVWLSILGAFVFAVFRGGVAERWAAGMVVAAALAAFVMHRLVSAEMLPLALLTGEFLLAVGFLVLAVRFASLWLGGAMILQAVQFSLHAWYLVAERPRDILYSVINNIDTMGILLCIVLGTAATWRRRRVGLKG
jgi:hypothetical protein